MAIVRISDVHSGRIVGRTFKPNESVALNGSFECAAGQLPAYRKMVVARRFDVQVTALTKQGRLATYPSAYGQEACEIGAVKGVERTNTSLVLSTKFDR